MPTSPKPPVPPTDRDEAPPGSAGEGSPQDTHSRRGFRAEDSPVEGESQTDEIRRGTTKNGFRPPDR